MPAVEIVSNEAGDTQYPTLLLRSPDGTKQFAVSIDNNGDLMLNGASIYALSELQVWGNEAGLMGSNQVLYAYRTGAPSITATEANAEWPMEECRVIAILGRNYTHATDYTITLRKNGVDTAMTSGLVEAIADFFRITTGGPISFAEGDLASLEIDLETGGGGSGFRGIWLIVERVVV